MGRWKWFSTRLSTRPRGKARDESCVPREARRQACQPPAQAGQAARQRDTLSDYCIGRPAPPLLDMDVLVDMAIRNEPRERERDELERHVDTVDTFSDELELLEPSGLASRFVQSLRNGGVLHPQSYWHLAWLLLVSACFVYNCVAIPLRSTFPYQTPDNWLRWFLCDLACDAVYLLDLVLVKPHVIFVYDGFWVREKHLTRKHYFAKWQFKMDIMSLVPLDALYVTYGTHQVLLRLPRLLRIQTFWELFDHLDSLLMSPYLVRVARTLSYMMYLVHLNACGYYAFSAREGLGANSWTFKGGEGNAYIRCFYFATKTATSVGKNPRPETEGEYLFMTCSWLMGVFVFALLIGQIRDIVATASRTRTEHRKRLDETLEHMRSLSLPDHVQRRVQSWFTFADQHQPFDEARILNSLPQKLKTDVALDVHGTTLAKVHLFQKIADQALIRDLVLKLRSCLYLPGDYICRKNEVGKEMYIVKTGQVEVLAPNNGEVLATLSEGCVFGEISLLALAGGNRRTADVRSKGFSNLFVLSKNDLHETLVYYPDAQKILKQKAEALMKENAERERRESRLLLRRSPTTSLEETTTCSEPDTDAATTDGDGGELQESIASLPRHHHHNHVKIRVTASMSPPASETSAAADVHRWSPEPPGTPTTPLAPPPSSPPDSPTLEEAAAAADARFGLTPSAAAALAGLLGHDAGLGLPSVHVTQATDHDSDLTSVTCTSLTTRTRSSGPSYPGTSSRSSRTSRASRTTASSSTSCWPPSAPATASAATDTGVAVCPDEDLGDDSDTLSDLSSTSLLSPMVSPTLEWRRPILDELQRRRVSAPTPTVTDVTDGSLSLPVPHRLSFPSSRRKTRAFGCRSNSHQ